MVKRPVSRRPKRRDGRDGDREAGDHADEPVARATPPSDAAPKVQPKSTLSPRSDDVDESDTLSLAQDDASDTSESDLDESVFELDAIDRAERPPRFAAQLRSASAFSGRGVAAEGGDPTTRWLLDANEIERGRLLGEGMFGTVYQGRWRNIDVAVKEMSVGQETDEAKRQFEEEALTMCRLRPHVNCLSLYGIVAEVMIAVQ